MKNYQFLRKELVRELRRKFSSSDIEGINDAVSEAARIVCEKAPPDEVLKNSYKLFDWYYTIAERSLLASIEKGRHEEHLADEADSLAAPDFAFRIANRQDTIEILRSLSEKEREALVLHKLNDMSVEEVAYICKITRNTVKDRLKRSMLHIRAFFIPEREREKLTAERSETRSHAKRGNELQIANSSHYCLITFTTAFISAEAM